MRRWDVCNLVDRPAEREVGGSDEDVDVVSSACCPCGDREEMHVVCEIILDVSRWLQVDLSEMVSPCYWEDVKSTSYCDAGVGLDRASRVRHGVTSTFPDAMIIASDISAGGTCHDLSMFP